MALISCYECDAEISDKAESCPKCGAPLEKTMSKTIEQNIDGYKEHSFLMTWCIIIFFLTLLLFTLYQNAEKEYDEAFQKHIDCFGHSYGECQGADRAKDKAEAKENNLCGMMLVSGIICSLSLIKLWADNYPGVVIEKTIEQE